VAGPNWRAGSGNGRRPDYPSYSARYTEKHREGEHQLEGAVFQSARRYPLRVVRWDWGYIHHIAPSSQSLENPGQLAAKEAQQRVFDLLGVCPGETMWAGFIVFSRNRRGQRRAGPARQS
jgi:hypothetical protein